MTGRVFCQAPTEAEQWMGWAGFRPGRCTSTLGIIRPEVPTAVAWMGRVKASLADCLWRLSLGFCFSVLEVGSSKYIAQVGLELETLSLLSAEIIDRYHHAWFQI